MPLLIADTFTDSLARLRGDEQKAVKTTVFDLQVDPTSPGLNYHKLDKAKDKRFWSVRVNSDIRIIVHRTGDSVLVCYVDHHDKAYQWAERRKVETHPKTGAAQLVEIRETVHEIVIPVHAEAKQPMQTLKPSLFGELSDDVLLGYGVPREWLADARGANEDTLLGVVEHLPYEAAEALLELATGGKPQAPKPAVAGSNPFTHPDAQRRFRVMSNVEELERALEYPWEKWTVFLHPAQREWVQRDQSGSARVSGSAGTGKTIVALHRAVHLARQHSESRVLLTTFSEILANALRAKLRRLISNEPRLAERLEVYSIDAIGERLYNLNFGQPKIAGPERVDEMLSVAAAELGANKLSSRFLSAEWTQVVDAWQIASWEQYRDVKRLGRKTRLPEVQRKALWAIFERVQARLAEGGLTTNATLFSRLASELQKKQPPFDFAVVDECQDLCVPHIRFLAALAGTRPNGLFFTGDLGQRIFQQPYSWKALGVDIRGRSRTLTVNYRTSHQIRMQADRLLGDEISDVDGNIESRRHTVSVFNGPTPTVLVAASVQAETETIKQWIASRTNEGVTPHELAIFVRSPAQIDRARTVALATGIPFTVLDEKVDTISGKLTISTMHIAKGLEFRTVVVMACDDEIIPLQERIEAITDEADLEDVYNTERHLLYVACTRARDHLLVTGVAPVSEFLEDLRAT